MSHLEWPKELNGYWNRLGSIKMSYYNKRTFKGKSLIEKVSNYTVVDIETTSDMNLVSMSKKRGSYHKMALFYCIIFY